MAKNGKDEFAAAIEALYQAFKGRLMDEISEEFSLGADPIDPPKADKCPFNAIIDLYHEKLPMCPRVIRMSKNRESAMRARWKNGSNGLEWWEGYFDYVAKSRFLTGRVDPTNGRPTFVADLDWLIKETNIIKVQEGKYHRG